MKSKSPILDGAIERMYERHNEKLMASRSKLQPTALAKQIRADGMTGIERMSSGKRTGTLGDKERVTVDGEPEPSDLAAKIARAIMSQGDGPLPCRRIQFKGGTYPDEESNQGGFIESSLAVCIRRSLANETRRDEDTIKDLLTALKAAVAVIQGWEQSLPADIAFVADAGRAAISRAEKGAS